MKTFDEWLENRLAEAPQLPMSFRTNFHKSASKWEALSKFMKELSPGGDFEAIREFFPEPLLQNLKSAQQKHWALVQQGHKVLSTVYGGN